MFLNQGKKTFDRIVKSKPIQSNQNQVFDFLQSKMDIDYGLWLIRDDFC